MNREPSQEVVTLASIQAWPGSGPTTTQEEGRYSDPRQKNPLIVDYDLTNSKGTGRKHPTKGIVPMRQDTRSPVPSQDSEVSQFLIHPLSTILLIRLCRTRRRDGANNIRHRCRRRLCRRKLATKGIMHRSWGVPDSYGCRWNVSRFPILSLNTHFSQPIYHAI